jgi:hypothetical protein
VLIERRDGVLYSRRPAKHWEASVASSIVREFEAPNTADEVRNRVAGLSERAPSED